MAEDTNIGRLTPRPEWWQSRDHDLLMRALFILHEMRLERTGWRRWVFGRWYYPDEPLRNDASRLVQEAGFEAMRPMGTKDISETGNG